MPDQGDASQVSDCCGGRRSRRTLRRQCAGRGDHDLEGANVLAGGRGSRHVQAMVRHDQGKIRWRTRIQAVRGEGSRRRFRTSRRREEWRARGDEFLHALLGRQGAGDGVPVVLSDGPALPARMGCVLLQQWRPEARARRLRQAGSDVCRPHSSRPEHHSFQEADPIDRGFQGPEAARARRHDRRRALLRSAPRRHCFRAARYSRRSKKAPSRQPTIPAPRSTGISASSRSRNTSGWVRWASSRSTSRST